MTSPLRATTKLILDKTLALLLLAYLLSLFLSTTAQGVIFVLGFGCWLIRAFFAAPRKFLLGDLAVSLLLLVSLGLAFFHGEKQLLIVLKDHLRLFFLWFWACDVLLALRPSKRSWAALAVLCSGALIGLLAFAQSLGFLLVSPHGPSGLHYQPYSTAGLLLFCLFFGLHELDSLPQYALRARPRRLLLCGVLAFILLGLVALGQRAVLLGAFGGASIYFLRKSWQQFIALLVLSGLGGLLAFQFISRFRDKLLRSLSLLSDKVGFGCRFELWKENFEAFRQHPVLGLGHVIVYDCFGDRLGHTHNVFLQQMVLGGLVGLFAFLQFLGHFAFHSLRFPRRHFALFCCLVAFCLEGLFENWWGDGRVNQIFLLLCVLIEVLRVKEEGKAALSRF